MTDSEFLENYEEKDYSERNILLIDGNTETAENTLDILRMILTGAKLTLVANIEEADIEYTKCEEAEKPYDTVVMDFRIPGTSDSDLVKRINNSKVVLVVLAFEQLLVPEDERSRSKLEPLRKLFDAEIKTTKARGS